MKFQVGELTNPKAVDPKFSILQEAIDHAAELASKDINAPFAVWDEACDVVTLFLCGQEFKPA